MGDSERIAELELGLHQARQQIDCLRHAFYALAKAVTHLAVNDDATAAISRAVIHLSALGETKSNEDPEGDGRDGAQRNCL